MVLTKVFRCSDNVFDKSYERPKEGHWVSNPGTSKVYGDALNLQLAK